MYTYNYSSIIQTICIYIYIYIYNVYTYTYIDTSYHFWLQKFSFLLRNKLSSCVADRNTNPLSPQEHSTKLSQKASKRGTAWMEGVVRSHGMPWFYPYSTPKNGEPFGATHSVSQLLYMIEGRNQDIFLLRLLLYCWMKEITYSRIFLLGDLAHEG